MSDQHPKREVERLRIPLPVQGAVTVFQPMTILNISVKGMLMECATPLHNDSLHDFRLTLKELSVVVKGRVVYCQIGELREGVVLYQCGIEFIEPPAHAAAAIGEFVETFKAPPPVIDAELSGE